MLKSKNIRLLVNGATSLIVLFLDLLVPKSKKVIIFSSNSNRVFSGNSKSIYDYLKNNATNYDYNFYYSQKEFVNDPHYLNLRSIKGLIIFLKAKTLIGTHGEKDFLYKFSKRKYYIQTWHGSPLKKIGISESNNPTKQKKRIKKSKKITYFLTPSEIVSNTLVRSWHLFDYQLLEIGNPRNDKLISKDLIDSSANLHKRYDADKIILYAPTYRQNIKTSFFPFKDFDISMLNLFLKKNKTKILIRAHINDKISYSKYISENIIDFSFEICNDVNDIIPFVDILITDYSSIYFDFLLLDRPCIFLPYDLKQYKHERGFFYDNYNFLMVGNKPTNQNQFEQSIQNCLLKPSEDSILRKDISKLFNSFQSGNSAHKILSKLNKLLNE